MPPSADYQAHFGSETNPARGGRQLGSGPSRRQIEGPPQSKEARCRSSSRTASLSPTPGAFEADVLDRRREGHCPGSTGKRSDCRRGDRRHRQVRHSWRDRRPHPHGAPVRGNLRLGQLRDRHPGGGLGRHHHHRRFRRADQGQRPDGGMGSLDGQGRRATAPSTTGSTASSRTSTTNPSKRWTSPSAKVSAPSRCSWPIRASSTRPTARSSGRCKRRPRTAPRS